ncbi:MAG: hypothetical protein RLZZ165_1053 [Bacteroidota bacterium]
MIKSNTAMNQDEYMKERVEDQIEWYSTKASLNKKWFVRLEMVSIGLSVSIPFVSNLMSENATWVKHAVSLMGILIAGISGLMGLMKYRENWLEYRTTCELLRHERYMFLTRAGSYASGDRFDLFVQTIENLLSKEAANWKSYVSTVSEKQNPAPSAETPSATAARSPMETSAVLNEPAQNPETTSTLDPSVVPSGDAATASEPAQNPETTVVPDPSLVPSVDSPTESEPEPETLAKSETD